MRRAKIMDWQNSKKITLDKMGTLGQTKASRPEMVLGRTGRRGVLPTDGVVDLSDLACFRSRYASGDARADCDHDGVLTSRDFMCFMLYLESGRRR